MKSIIQKWQTIATALSSGLICLLTIIFMARPPWDPDLGWHIKNGEDIWKYGAPHGDIYSFTMPSYPWISHEWLSDALLWWLNKHFGMIFISILFALIVFLAFLIAARIAKVNWQSSLITILIASLVGLNIVGIRMQMLTLLGLAVTLWILFKWREQPKNHLIWWLPLLMLGWVNLHGGFAAGLLLMGVFGLAELLRYAIKKLPRCHKFPVLLSPKNLWELIAVGIASFAVTFINPYGWKIYEELYKTIFNEVVRKGISEWMPVVWGVSESYNLLIYAILLIVLLIFYWRKADFTKLFIAIVFFFVSISSWRHLPLFPLVSLPLLTEIIDWLSAKELRRLLSSIWTIIITASLVVYVGIDRYQTIVPAVSSESMFGAVTQYPFAAVDYIKTHSLSGNMFNEYNWGGYLIWKLPEHKVFIDGRMAIWETPSQNIFKEYMTVSSVMPDTITILDKYKIDFALVFSNRPLKDYLLGLPDGSWEVLYTDNLATVLHRRHPFYSSGIGQSN